MTENSLNKNKNILIFISSIVLIWGISLQIPEAKDTIWNYLFNTGYGLIFFISGLICLFFTKKRQIEGTPKKALNYMGYSFLMYGIALFIWTYYNLSYGEDVPYPGLPDMFFVLYDILLFFSIYQFVRMFSIVVTKRIILKSILIFTGLSILILYLTKPEISSETPTLESLLNIFYPLTSVFLLSSSFIMLQISGGGLIKDSIQLTMGIFLIGLSDLIFTIKDMNGTYWNGDISDLLTATSAVILGLSSINIIEDLTFKK